MSRTSRAGYTARPILKVIVVMLKKKSLTTNSTIGPMSLTPEEALFKALNTAPIKKRKRVAKKTARDKKDQK